MSAAQGYGEFGVARTPPFNACVAGGGADPLERLSPTSREEELPSRDSPPFDDRLRPRRLRLTREPLIGGLCAANARVPGDTLHEPA